MGHEENEHGTTGKKKQKKETKKKSEAESLHVAFPSDSRTHSLKNAGPLSLRYIITLLIKCSTRTRTQEGGQLQEKNQN